MSVIWCRVQRFRRHRGLPCAPRRQAKSRRFRMIPCDVESYPITWVVFRENIAPFSTKLELFGGSDDQLPDIPAVIWGRGMPQFPLLHGRSRPKRVEEIRRHSAREKGRPVRRFKGCSAGERKHVAQRTGGSHWPVELIRFGVRLKKPREPMEIGLGADVADHGHECFGIDQLLERHVVQIELPGDGDHHAVEALFD